MVAKRKDEVRQSQTSRIGHRGSLGGLCAGICLRAAGWRVSIFERSLGPMEDRGAGIVLQSEVLTLLEGLKLTTREDISVESHERQYLNKDGGVYSSGPQPAIHDFVGCVV
jgi:2-polyprenyl-6-methoxyphenol hydroxylase-like FAD-dependent oxidoreductase